ncbi:MAG: hypothetical protein KGJ66_06160 [Alphaproteobacteria bacterium]|nr:hypothetical protein [Alphaproteobacteria bacterium]
MTRNDKALRKPRFYFYKMTCDDGGAPCVEYDLLSLAICKPMIRSTAQKGDVVIGFAANSLSDDNRLIYIAKITTKKCNGAYFRSHEHSGRADCIYEWVGDRPRWRRQARYHSPNELVHDLGKGPRYSRADVLLSTKFRYFGRKGTDGYKRQFPAIKSAIEKLAQGHRVRHNAKLGDELRHLVKNAWRDSKRCIIGKPHSDPVRGVCHGYEACASIILE